MIKVNLLRNRVAEGAQTETVMGSAGGGDQARESLVKLGAILLPTIGLMFYEHQTISSLNETQSRLQAEGATLQSQNTAKLAEVAKVKDVEIQAKELEDKLKILKLLSRLRLRGVKTLDFMQSSIPEKLWLKSIVYDSDKARVESGHFTFQGHSVATEDLTEFVKRLEDSAFLQDVIVVKNQEITMGKNAVLREFLFTAEVENKN
jgi:Tfp pilus assembly protein PilN